MKYILICMAIILLMTACRTVQISSEKESKRTTTIIEKLVDTAIHTGTDSLLSAYRYDILNGQLNITPLWKFGSSVLENRLRVDTLTQTLYVHTLKHDTIIKLLYKNIYRIDTFEQKRTIIEQVTTNKLNAWQKIVQGFGYVFMGIIALLLIWGGIKLYFKFKPI